MMVGTFEFDIRQISRVNGRPQAVHNHELSRGTEPKRRPRIIAP
jgi:hypothetical protein